MMQPYNPNLNSFQFTAGNGAHRADVEPDGPSQADYAYQTNKGLSVATGKHEDTSGRSVQGPAPSRGLGYRLRAHNPFNPRAF